MQELLDYKTMQGYQVQLSIVEKVKLPVVIELQSQYSFEIKLEGK